MPTLTQPSSLTQTRLAFAFGRGRLRGREMIKTVKVEDAVGLKLAHDITEIRPGEFKGPAFRQGHSVCEDDLCRLQRLGKNHLYVIDLEEDEIHENEAAAILAHALAGDGHRLENNPREGKIDLYAADDGLLTVNTRPWPPSTWWMRSCAPPSTTTRR